MIKIELPHETLLLTVPATRLACVDTSKLFNFFSNPERSASEIHSKVNVAFTTP